MREKLAKAYEAVVAKLPGDAQEILNEYWRSVSCRRVNDHYSPDLHIRHRLYKPLRSRIKLARGPMESVFSFASRLARNLVIERVYSQCLGDQILFAEELVEKAEVHILEIVIGEEIAHCFQAAPTKKTFPGAAAILGLDEETLEREGKALALKWGFDTKIADAWCAENL